jgi:1,4-alpha-glucan branching enzyme
MKSAKSGKKKSRLLHSISSEEVERLVAGEHSDPHRILGAHPSQEQGETGVVIRAFHPDAKGVEVCIENREVISLAKVHERGLFAGEVDGHEWPFHYRLVFHFADGATWDSEDPYRFLPSLGELDLHLTAEGTHQRLYQCLGAHPRIMDGVKGVAFAVWAPNARRVSLIGDFNRWDGRLYPMRSMGSSGIWELFVPELEPGALYKFEIKTREGALRIKADPYAFAMELRPKTGSIVWDHESYTWQDADWMESRREWDPREKPLAIYEVHFGSWMRVPEEGERWLTYRELAPRLIEHVKNFGFTHIELLPVAEHPFDGSWGYQVTGYFSPTSRYGNPDDFKFFVDSCHRNGIGVIMDWVPAHFPRDDYSLRWFDGTALYEHADPKKGEHKDWGTLIFNYGRVEVRNFLLANALFWLDLYHIDGLRADAVASMLYLDYSRDEGDWIPNRYGGRENLEAIDFIHRLNELTYGLYPGCFTVAEESTAWSGVTVPVYLGGLGFGFKWDMGWMHDTLEYFSKDPVHRRFHHNQLTFSMMYNLSENFILPLSHDEVVHGKGSLLNKMPGDTWQKFANLRVLLGYLYTHPGKKLLFMGSELAPDSEWNHDRSLDWHLGSDPMRQKFQEFLKDMARLYLSQAALWKWDHRREGFSWIDCQDADSSVVSYIRFAEHEHLVCVLNLTPVPRQGYRVGVPGKHAYREILNSDSELYGGSNMGNLGKVKVEKIPFHAFPNSISLTLPPLSIIILEPEG